ncbi:MAG: arylsulfotransferase family protein [Verrucomicrobiota bacterium]
MKLNFEKIAFAKLEAWVVVLLVFLGLIGLTFFAWFLRVSLENPNATFWSRVAVNLSHVPEQGMTLLREGVEFDAEGRLVQRNVQIARFDDYAGLDRVDPDFKDDGTVLVSAYDDTHRIAIVYLLDPATGERLWTWVPNHAQIVERTPNLRRRAEAGELLPYNNEKSLFLSMHPYLLDDGRLLLHAGSGVLAMLDRDGDVLWTSDKNYHHAIERDADGNFVIPTEVFDGKERICTSGYAVVSPEGKVLEEVAVEDLLVRNGHGGLLYGLKTWNDMADAIHVNDVEPILESDAYVRRGDLVISCRHLSTVFLYRPSEDRILWLQTGPWLNQHDPDYLGDGVFSIFNNNLIRDMPEEEATASNLMYYDMKTGEVTTADFPVFETEGLYTETQGLHRHLDNGDVFVEMQNSFELIRLSPEGIRWRYVHPLSTPGEIGHVHWSRYFQPGERDLSWIEEAKAPPAP